MKLEQLIAELIDIRMQCGDIDVVVTNCTGNIADQQRVTVNKLRQEDHEETCIIETEL